MTQLAAVTTKNATLAADLAAKVVDYVAAAKAPNTRRAYRAAWRQFEAWCGSRGVRSLPASPSCVAAYVADRAGTLKVSTLSLHVVAIGQAHEMAKLVNPTKSLEVRAVLQGVRRAHGTAPDQKAPLMTGDVTAIVHRLGATTADVRNRALLLLGFACGFRRSEVVGLDVGDIEFRSEGMVVHVRRSKVDQVGVGRTVGVGHGTSGATCPVTAVRRWLQLLGVKSGPLFRPVDRHGAIRHRRLTTRSVARIVKALGAEVGLDPRVISGHSLRSGFATSAAAAGIEERQIAEVTGHRSITVLRGYVRQGTLFDARVVERLGL